MDIVYVTGDATLPQGAGRQIIVHVCNDVGKWGRGFVLAISQRWPEPELRYRRWAEGEEEPPFELGAVQFVPVGRDLWVANLIGQHDVRRAGGTPPIRYEAVRLGLARVAVFATDQGASVHMPRIGAGLAGGEWEIIEGIIREELSAKGISATVYELP
jgi:O-acetyl-ADP-ribose deacetylase (regulator of RNase III)